MAPPKDAFGGLNGVIAMISTIGSRQFWVIEASAYYRISLS
jgi:hypothetical protein